MRVLLVSTGYPPDGLWGTETYAGEIARGLVARGHEVLVLHPLASSPVQGSSGSPGARREVCRDGIRVVQVVAPRARSKRLRESYEHPGFERAFAAVLAEFHPACAHFLHLLWSLSVHLPALAHAAGVPTVLTLTDLGLLCHRGQRQDWRLEPCGGGRTSEDCARCIREPAPFDAGPATLFLKRLAVRSLSAAGGLGRVVGARDVERRTAVIARALLDVDRCLAPTRAMARAFAAAGFPEPEVLPYALDERPLARARALPREDVARIRFFGQLAPHKGPATLLAAAELLARLAGDRPWAVHLHGAPSAGPRHRRYAIELARRARDPRVHLEPPFAPAELPRILARTSALVIPSEWMENRPSPRSRRAPPACPSWPATSPACAR